MLTEPLDQLNEDFNDFNERYIFIVYTNFIITPIFSFDKNEIESIADGDAATSELYLNMMYSPIRDDDADEEDKDESKTNDAAVATRRKRIRVQCTECSEQFDKRIDLNRHILTDHSSAAHHGEKYVFNF